MSNPLDRRAIKARADAATPGPWLGDPTGTVCAAADVVPDGQGGEILPEDGPMEVAECYRSVLPGERAKNADFIAHARTDVPALLTLVEELAAERALLAQRYGDLKARVLAGGWSLVVEEVEAAELREEGTRGSRGLGGGASGG